MSTDLLIQGAADWELEPLIDALDDRRESHTGIWTCWTGSISQRSVAVQRTDWGPINAVAATVAAIESLRPAAIISQGMAGAHDPELKVGDIVVAEQTVDHSAYKSASMRRGAGVDPAHRQPIAHRLRTDLGALHLYESFPSDAALVEAALAVPNERGRVLRGVIGSAYQYNRELDMIVHLRRVYRTDCEDMESAFAAGAATVFGVSFVAIRMISNSEWNCPELDKSAGPECARFVIRVIESLGEIATRKA